MTTGLLLKYVYGFNMKSGTSAEVKPKACASAVHTGLFAATSYTETEEEEDQWTRQLCYDKSSLICTYVRAEMR